MLGTFFILMVVVVVVAAPGLGALVEQGQVRIRHGSPVRQEWATITFDGPSRLPQLEDSESYDPYTMTEYVSVENDPFSRITMYPGPPRLSLHPTSELLITARCLTLSAHELTLSPHPCPTTDACVACERDGHLCAFNTTLGRVELLADSTVLVPEISHKLRFGVHVALGPLTLRPGEAWVRGASSGGVTRLSLDALGYDQVLYFDLGSATLCTAPQRVEQHTSFARATLTFSLVISIAGAAASGMPRALAIALGVVASLASLVGFWAPLRLDFPLAGPVYAFAALQVLAGVVAGVLWVLGPAERLRLLVLNGAWAALWMNQYQTGSAAWESLAGLVVLSAWTWVALRTTLLRPGAVVLVTLLWWFLTLRNPLLIGFPAAPAALLVGLIVFVATGPGFNAT